MMKQYIMNEIKKTIDQCDMLQTATGSLETKAEILKAKAEVLKAWAIICAAENLDGLKKIEDELERLEDFDHSELAGKKVYRSKDITMARIQGILYAKRVLIED